MRTQTLQNAAGQRLMLSGDNMWFVDFPLMLQSRTDESLSTATDIRDVYAHLADNFGCDYMVDEDTMRVASQMRLSRAGRKFMIKVTPRDLGLGGEPVTITRMMRAAKGFGLRHCPIDTPLFTHMQTNRFLQPGGDLGQVLYFPRYTFAPPDMRRWRSKKVLWTMHTPLDFTCIRWFDVERKFTPSRFWAFEVPADIFNPAKFRWPNNRRPFSSPTPVLR